MKKVIMILMAVALVALPTMAQSFGGQEQPNNVAFQSTSTLTPSGSVYSPNPALNEDGTAYNPAATTTQTSSGPRKAKHEDPVVPEGDPTPLGDAVLPLMLCALAFCGVIYLRRRRICKG